MSLLLALLPGCGDDIPYPTPPALPGGTFVARAIEWNTGQVALGRVKTVAEHGDEVVLLSEDGVRYFSAGLLRSKDPGTGDWRQAALLPAADGAGEWFVGVDGGGRLLRLRSGGALEDVREHYDLGAARVSEAVALGAGHAAFALEAQGLTVTIPPARGAMRFPGTFAGIVGGGGRALAVEGGMVRVLDPRTGGGRSYALPSVVAAVFDPAGKLVVATEHSLYVEAEGGTLQRVHEEPEARIAGLVVAGTAVWVALGDTLGLWRGGHLLRAQPGLLPAGARLLGTPAGDVWVLADGRLSRYGEEGSGTDLELWKKTVLPVFTRACSQCHLPGTALADLSTYAAWTSRRELIGQRVLQGKPTPMPPAGAPPLMPAELAAIRRWVMGGK